MVQIILKRNAEMSIRLQRYPFPMQCLLGKWNMDKQLVRTRPSSLWAGPGYEAKCLVALSKIAELLRVILLLQLLLTHITC